MTHRSLLCPFLLFRQGLYILAPASFISALLAMDDTYQVCSEVVCNPGGAGIRIMKFGIAFSSTCQGGGATVDSGFIYDFSIRLLFANSIRFSVTIYHCSSSSYFTSAAKSFSSRAHLFFFHCSGSSPLNFLSATLHSLLNHCLLL